MQGKVQHRFCRSAKRSLAKATASFVLIAICALHLISAAKADIRNTAQATGTYNGVTANYGSSTQSVPVATATAAITLTKIDKGLADTNSNGIRDPGDTVTYGFTIKNTGNVTLNNINLMDGASPVPGGPISLIPNASDTATFTWTYVLTAADFTAGSHSNTATVSGVGADAASTPVSASSTVSTSLTYVATYTFTKSATLATTPPKAGDIATYTLTVKNTGDSPLFNVTVTDPLLASNEKVNSHFMAMIDNANRVDAQDFITASLGDTPHHVGIVESANRQAVALAKVPRLNSEFVASRQLVRMSGGSGPLVAGEKIGFVYTLSNAGEGPITNVRIAQPDSFAFGSDLSLLNPNETDAASIIFTRDLTDQDIASGAAHSNAYVTWIDRGRESLLQLAGDVPLTTIKVYDQFATASISPASVTQLDPNQTTVFTAPYTLTQSDIDAGTRHNLATATAKDIGGNTISHTATFDLPLPQVPAVGVVKAATLNAATPGTPRPGDTITYKFTVTNLGNVTLNPVTIADATPGVTVTGSPIANLAPGAAAADSTAYTAIHTLTQADVDAGKFQNQATVTAKPPLTAAISATSDPVDPKLHNPTIVPLPAQPAIGLLKDVTSITDVNGNGLNDKDDIVHYSFTVYNLGNVTLHGITVVDKLGAPVVIVGSPIVASLPPAPLAGPPSTNASVTGSYPITQADVDAGFITNSATAKGFAPDGTPVVHDSDPLVPTGNAPTVQPLAQTPQAALFKKMKKWTDTNGDGAVDAGDQIDYSFIVKNTGNVTLTNLKLTEMLALATPAVNATAVSLIPGAVDSTTFTTSYIIQNSDVTAGVVKNRAQLDTTQVGGIFSNSGDLTSSTPGTTDTPVPQKIGLILRAPSYADTNGDGVIDAGDTLTYPVEVKNAGASPLNVTNLADANVVANSLVPNVTSSGALASGNIDTTTFKMSHVLTVADVALGAYNAQAKVTGTVTLGSGAVNITDLSDSTDFTKDAPTPYVIPSIPGIAVLKAVDHYENAALAVQPDPATGLYAVYKITVKNTGNVPFDAVTIAENAPFTDPVTGTIPAPFVAGAIDSTHVVVKHLITNAEMLAGHFDNQVMATGANSAKLLSVNDLSDPSDFTKNAVTLTGVVAKPQIAIIKTYVVEDVNGNGANDMGDIIHYSFTVKNIGNVDLTNVTLTDVKLAITDAATSVFTPTTIPLLKVGDTDSTTFKEGPATAFKATHTIISTEVINVGSYSNQATALGTFDPANPGAVTSLSDDKDLSGASHNPTVTPLSIARPVLTKTAARSQVKRGDVVAYTITALNVSSIQYQLVDIMPPGFGFAAGSATANGVAVTPVINGQVLTFNGLVPTKAKLVLNLRLIASATLGGGKFVNTARLIQQDNNNVLAVAQATVEVVPDAVFDCSDIIGRVFDDLNGDGYYQAGEPGLPGVRLATLNGELITTDDQGRYHVPCAAIPDAAIGSNFVLKLDPRTLPQGYKVTTENPRDVRVTRGKATELNFGAAKHRQVKVDVTGKAFAQDSTELVSTWASGVTRLCKILGKTSSDLSLVYHQKGETGELAQSRVDALEATIRQACDAKHSLKIETQVEEGK